MKYSSLLPLTALLAVKTLCFRAGAFYVSSLGRRRSVWTKPINSYQQCSSFGENNEARGVRLQNISLEILYEDDDLLAIHKPTGMVVQHSSGSVENALAFYLNHSSSNYTFASPTWPWKSPYSFEGIVHRLDKGTSGVMVVAKNPQAARTLQASFEERRVNKTYLAIAHGLPSQISRETTSIDKEKDEFIETYIEPLPLPHQKRLSKDIKNCGNNVAKALELLDTAEDPSASCFSAAISVCRRAGEREKALSLLDSITSENIKTRAGRHRNIKPNLLSFKTATSLCALDPPLWEKAVELVSHTMPANGLSLHPHCISSAIAACGRAGRLNETLALLELMPQHPACLAAAAKACERCNASGVAREIMQRGERNQSESSKASDIIREDSNLRLGEHIRVDSPIGKVGGRTMGIVMGKKGRDACSVVTPLVYKSGKSLNRVEIETGRTHQIRVHMANVLRCPLVGDTLYGKGKEGGRLMLHAAELTIPHPTTNVTLHFECLPPADFANVALEIVGSIEHPMYQKIWKAKAAPHLDSDII